MSDPVLPPVFFRNNYDIAYQLGLFDTLSLIYTRVSEFGETQDQDRLHAFVDRTVPWSLLQSIDLRRGQDHASVVINTNITRAATLSQRAIDETTNTAGSLTDFIVFSLPCDAVVYYYWVPSVIAYITGRPTSIMEMQQCDRYTNVNDAISAGKSFMCPKFCRFISVNSKKLIKNIAREKCFSWSMKLQQQPFFYDTSIMVSNTTERPTVVVCPCVFSSAILLFKTIITALSAMYTFTGPVLEYISTISEGQVKLIYFVIAVPLTKDHRFLVDSLSQQLHGCCGVSSQYQPQKMPTKTMYW